VLQAPPIVVTRVDLSRLHRLLTSPALRDSPAAEALADELERAEVVEPAALPRDVVSMHSTVRVAEQRSGRELELTLVYPGETGEADRVSVLAPVGSALLGLAVGSEIEWPLPGGEMTRIKVLAVPYQPEAEGLDLQ